MGLWSWFWGSNPHSFEELTQAPRKPIEPTDPADRMFIADRERFTGIIMKAEIRRSKTNGKPYIWLEISYDGIDRCGAVLSRLMYTNYVLKFGLAQDYESTEFNVARLVGGRVKIRFDYKTLPIVAYGDSATPYSTAVILEILP